jgi:hypothetical protein
LHYREDHLRNGERGAKSGVALVSGGRQISVAIKRQNLPHCDLLLRHWDKSGAGERNTYTEAAMAAESFLAQNPGL